MELMGRNGYRVILPNFFEVTGGSFHRVEFMKVDARAIQIARAEVAAFPL